MSDMEGMMPQLTLNADAAKVEAPALTLSLEPEPAPEPAKPEVKPCLLYTSDAADD